MNSNYETKVFQVHTEGDRFGFTLAGEHPCQLVKIQNDSPAERAGLVSGDEVLEVNGINMGDLQHDLVASFICPSIDGITEFRIRRSVDREQPYRPCETTERSDSDSQNSITEDITCPVSSRVLSKVVDRVVEEFKSPPQTVAPSSSRALGPSVLNGIELASDEELRASFSPETSNLNTYTAGNISTPSTPPTCSKSVQTAVHWTRELSKIQTVLGYLGSIDCPMTTRTAGDLLVTHLRVKKESSVTALLEITPVGLYLRKSSHEIIMTCSTTSLTFVGICPENKQIFGLFTRGANAQTSKVTTVYDRGEITSDLNLNCSCHLFAIEPRLTRHPAHKTLTDRFHLRCNSDPTTGSCQQFPTSSSAIINAIYTLLKYSSTQIPSNEPETVVDGQIQGTSLGCSGPVVGESSGNDSSAVPNLSLQDDNEHELVLCLHLHPLDHTPLTRKQEMNNQPPQELNLGKNYENRSTVSQNSSSSSSASVTEIATSTQHNHARSMAFRVDQSIHQHTPECSPQQGGKENRGHHKTLIHRRSRSLASNAKNTLHACQATQTTECYSQNDFRIGNGGRPMFHSSSASITLCNAVNSVEGRVARWAVTFDRLLEDSTGVDIFRSFLQKEYSEENLIFWLSCKKYRTICDKNELKIFADEIYDIHLKSGATLPVNVESLAVRDVEAKLQNATTELFTVLQYQVYTLMKFDSYTRFLKSDLYRKCLVDEMEGKPLPLEHEDSKKGDDFSGTLKRMFGSSTKMRGWKSLNKSQSHNETDETKKKSFLPWRVRAKSEQIKKTCNRGSDSQASSARSSMSSLSDSVFTSTITNSDETLTDSDGRDQVPPSCRVILPNRSLMYLFCKSTRSLEQGLSKLCEKMEYSLPALDLCIANRKLTKDDLEMKLTRFINKEIVLKEGVLFRLHLPNDMSIGVKADGEKTIDKVLEPILRESGIDIKDIAVCLRDKKQPLNTNCLVSSLHKHHVIIEEHSNHRNKSNDVRKMVVKNSETSLVARSNEDSVFDGIMGGKRQSMAGFSFDENGVFVPVIKPASSKDSLLVHGSKDKEQGSRSPGLFRKKKRDDGAGSQSVSTFKSFVVENDKKGAEELFSLLRRSQNSRLDDQRGLLSKEVELPDFLKLPEKLKRSSVFDVGVPSPRTQHSPLKKTNSSPASYVPPGNKPTVNKPTGNKPTRRTHPSTITERPAYETGFSRNLSGSSLNRGRTKIDGGLQVTSQTQTMVRRRFMNKTLCHESRLRSGSLPPDNPEHVLISDSVLRTETRYHHYGSELSFENNDKHVVWVTNATPTKNRRRGGDRTNHSGQVGDGSQAEDEGDRPNSSKEELIVPDVNRNAVCIPNSSAVGLICDRPKPITDSSVFREYIESNKLNMPTSDGQSHDQSTTMTSDREAVLDNSFLREQLKPSRLFSQLSPDMNTPLVTSSPTENLESIKCPLFSPSAPNLEGGGDSARDDSITDEFPYDNLVFRRSLRSHEIHAVSTNGSGQAVGDSGRHGERTYWGANEIRSEEDSVRVTFV